MPKHDVTTVQGLAGEMLYLISESGCDWTQALLLVTNHKRFSFQAWAGLLHQLVDYLAAGGEAGPLGTVMLEHAAGRRGLKVRP